MKDLSHFIKSTISAWLENLIQLIQENQSLRFQINLSIVLSSLIILVIVGTIAIWQAKGSVRKEIDSSLHLTLQLINLGFSQSQQTKFDINTWLQGLTSLQETRHLKIIIEKPNGKTVQIPGNQKHLNGSKKPPLWFMQLVTVEYSDVNLQLTNHQGEPLNITIKAHPLDEISEVWAESQFFFVSILLMIVVTFLAVNLVFNEVVRSTGFIVKRVQAIEKGRYHPKLPDFSIKEYGQIAGAINHLTDVLEHTQKVNSALALHALEIQEDERKGLSQELHDELGQSLTAIKVMAVTAKTSQSDKTIINDSIIEVCDRLINVVRSMMRNLHPMMLAELGLKATLEDLVNHWSQHRPELTIHLVCSETVNQYDQKIAIQVFRVIQECLTNIIRHAEASEAKIMLKLIDNQQGETTLHLSVQDNGKGSSKQTINTGFGLLGMRERVNSLGGKFSIVTHPGEGMRVLAIIPLS